MTETDTIPTAEAAGRPPRAARPRPAGNVPARRGGRRAHAGNAGNAGVETSDDQDWR